MFAGSSSASSMWFVSVGSSLPGVSCAFSASGIVGSPVCSETVEISVFFGSSETAAFSGSWMFASAGKGMVSSSGVSFSFVIVSVVDDSISSAGTSSWAFSSVSVLAIDMLVSKSAFPLPDVSAGAFSASVIMEIRFSLGGN